MAGIKIINVLKDDTLAEILELFRQAPSGEVIFVLPKNGKVFKKEDHFAAFASEANGSDKTISILSSNPDINLLARKYKFTVMSSSKPVTVAKSGAKKKIATLASHPLPADDDKNDPNEDAYEKDDNVVTTSDETMGIDPVDDVDILPGFHEVDEEGEKVETPPIPPDRGDMDYIDAMWKAKAMSAAPTTPTVELTAVSTPVKKWWKNKVKASPTGVSKRFAAGILIAAVVVLGSAVYITTGSAEVVIKPTAKKIDSQIQVQASDTFAVIDSNFAKLPGQLISITKTVTDEVQSSGQRDVASKARGKITVYNEYSNSPQSLVATTRFTSADGLIFRTLQSISVPGSTVKNGKIVAGSIEVDVIADKPGASYNISAGNFKVAAFVEKGDTDKAQKIYGVSTNAMTGGANGPSRVVTQQDYDAALKNTTDDLNNQIKTSANQLESGMMILDQVTPSISSTTASAKADDAADSVSVTMAGTLKTIAFRQTDLFKLLKDQIMQKERLTVIPEQLQLSYSSISFNADTGLLSFTVSIKGVGYTPLDESAITGDIRGKNAQQVRDYFANREGVQSASVSLAPFWVRSVPDQDSRITVKLDLSNPDTGTSAN